MSEINNKIDEIIEFFEDSSTWDREGLVDDMLHGMAELKGISAHEIYLEHEEYLTDLESFANDFFLETLEKVVAVIETFKEKNSDVARKANG